MVELGILIAVLIGIGQVAKQLGLPSKYLPLINLVLGIVGGLTILDGTVAEQVVYGAAMGLSASGLFDQTKIVTRK
jgi:NhaP-type Na+/H+ or K+/H+ antiporter